MKQDPGLSLSIISALDVAVLLRKGNRKYEMYGMVPDFYLRLFPGKNGEPSTTPWNVSDMLDFFLDDVEDFFSRNSEGNSSLTSGVWQEDGIQAGELALLATAMCLGDSQVLVVRLLGDEFIDRRRILQKAREYLLERRTLYSDLEIYRHMAQFDSLTALNNRAAFMECLQNEADKITKDGGFLSLLLIDIDNFKRLNDVYGHLAGDSVLAAFGQLLIQSLRREDMAARYGGEEFAVLAPFTTQQQALQMAEKLRGSIAQHDFAAMPSVTVSIGCATYKAGELLDSFIQRADLALYDAKKSGKNCVRVR